MFWKKDKPHSISTKLGLAYTLFSILLLCVILTTIYFHLSTVLNENSIRFVDDQLSIIWKIIHEHPNDIAALQEEVMWEPLQAERNYMVRLLNKNEKMIIETPGMNKLLPTQLFKDTTIHAGENLKSFIYYSPSSQRYYRLVSAWKEVLFNKTHSRYLTQVAVDVTRNHDVLEQYKRYLIFILLFGSMASGIITNLITYRAFQPLKQIIKKIKMISVHRLEERLPTQQSSTELTELVDAFNQSMLKIQEGYEKLKQFSSDIAHELRTPIQSLLLEVESCLSRKNISKEVLEETLFSALEEYKRLSSIIEQLLFLSKAENARVALQVISFEAREEIDKVLDMFEASAEEKQIQIDYRGSGKILADRNLFRRVITNLVSNAIKYTPQNGKVNVEIQNFENKTQIDINDSGVGITHDNLTKIFDRFYRVDDSRNRFTGGCGLGLAIVKAIVELHDACIEVSSEINRGSQFRLIFKK